ncbi:MAG: DUF2868 domain-containing protein, partial [Chromatocurvus sp.]
RTLWPEAVPDLSLVEATRFYRAGAGMTDVPPSRWGDWWPFIMMLWLTYVVLPRAILLAVAQGHIVLRARRALHSHAGWRALQYRMETPTLDTGNGHSDAEDTPGDFQGAAPRPLPAAAVVIYWGGVADDSLPAAARDKVTLACVAGGRATLESDRQTLQQVADALADGNRNGNGNGNDVLLVTRGWEPPTGELQDFMEAAQSLWPSWARLTIVPVSHDSALRVPRQQLPQWLRLQERFPAGFVSVAVIEPRPARAKESEPYA